MAFNDEDLKAFTKQHAKTIHTKEFPTRCGTCRLLALLAAATKVCDAVGSIECDPTEITGMEDTLEAFEAWRKAAGK